MESNVPFALIGGVDFWADPTVGVSGAQILFDEIAEFTKGQALLPMPSRPLRRA